MRTQILIFAPSSRCHCRLCCCCCSLLLHPAHIVHGRDHSHEGFLSPGNEELWTASARTKTAGHVPQPFDSEKVPLILEFEVRRFLRVANQIEAESPRAAYLCRVHAFERAHSMDKNSIGRGVRQFKTALLKHLEQAEEGTKRMRRESSDALELKYLYDKYHNKRRISPSESRYESINILLEVLKAVLSGTDSETFADGEEIKGNSANYFRYNILPLHPDSSQQEIMRLPEIKASLAAIRNVRGLPSDKSYRKESAPIDLIDWLQHIFGFQEGNVANQREHLVLLLANLHIRQIPKPTSMSKLDDRAIDELMEKLFKNYRKWCTFLGRKSNIWLPDVKQEEEQQKILYISLYLLIWGEASNLRLMPECLCYIFHHMAYELSGVLAGSISLNTREKVVPACGGEPESFLRNVVTPLYTVISEEARRNSNGTADHSKWRNYDDLNEYFWCIDCFKLGWPMRLECGFFSAPSTTKDRESETTTRKWIGKTNFVEIRSFLHLYRSFDRMWAFFILAFQLMVIIAWHNLESPLEVFNSPTFEDIMSNEAKYEHFPNARSCVEIFGCTIWVITLPVYYVKSRQDSFCSADEDWSQFGRQCLPQYMVAVAIYMTTNAIEMALFFLPSVGSFIETSDWRIFGILFWWAQPRLYIGRGMQEHQITLLKYSMFWLLLLPCKLAFSFQFEIKPLVESTKQIMEMSVRTYEWHAIFPKVKNNFGAVLAIWTPTTIVYFMDTQIWYSIFCSVFGGFTACSIRTMGMVRSKFSFLPAAFSARLIPPPVKKRLRGNARGPLGEKPLRETEAEGRDYVTFAAVWNQIIYSFREEDLISDRERDLMIVPLSSGLGSSGVHWPLFLLATKFSAALSIAREFVGEYRLLDSKIRSDVHMYSAVKECYDLLNNILDLLVVGDRERRIVSAITTEVETSVSSSNLLSEFRMNELPALHEKFIQLVEILLENNRAQSSNLVELLQDIFEIVTKDMMIHGHRSGCWFIYLSIYPLQSSTLAFQLGACVWPRSSEGDGASFLEWHEAPLFTPKDGEPVLRFPLPDDGSLKEQVRRLFLLLTAEETAMDIPINLEARRRVTFFATSLFMDMPDAPKARNMLSFSPIFRGDLHSSQDGASILSYMQKIYPDEWKNFLERMGYKASERPFVEDCDEGLNREITNWASFRGQTLSRTVRGMMYYREAIRFQAFLDMAKTEGTYLWGIPRSRRACGGRRGTHSLWAQMDELADIKFTYVVSCQVYGEHKASGDPRARHILDLMIRYPSLRVAYIEEKEVIGPNKPQKVYSSVLVKAVNGLEQKVYRIKLPGPPIIGEGKPENQNQGIIFTRGEALQTIDMNQDNYMEEAFKMRNVLQELLNPKMDGLRQYWDSESTYSPEGGTVSFAVSSLAWFMSYQESSFVTIGQRFLAKPLRVRFHYGHPDIFDRIFHVTRGGLSKASKTINLSEDVFAGFNTTLRCGSVTYREYMKIGKGRDIANGNGEQALSRDVFRLGRRFDFFRMLSCYFTTVGFYLSGVMSVLAVYGFLYGQLYLGLSGLERALIDGARTQNMRFLETALASQSFIQMGLLTGLPMMMEVALEKGFREALTDFILMHLQLASVFFTFSLGTKLHYFGRTILHGGAKYRPTGRKFVVFHASFTENYRLYSRSHFVKGFELLFLLILHNLYGSKPHGRSAAYALVTCSIWFLTLTWLFTPFIFNPSGFAWWKIVEDWMDWNRWMKNQGDLGLRQDKSWETWWNDEQLHIRYSGLGSVTLDILLSLRFFVYQYGLNIVVYVLSWAVIVAIFLLVKAVVLLGVVTAVMVLFSVCRLSVMDLFVCCFAFVPTGWGLLRIAQAIRPKIEGYSIWSSVEALAYTYDYVMGLLLFAPVAALAWMPVVSAIQTRVLFNQAFTRHLQIQPILGAKSKRR
ncbi:unnamed protein product [Spirodela intermedia]|uniref:1,3-beta-glucan synthase n=1 Tax=Spirodela intermedia TaxID=51605 RepID=A0A7I8JM78_SPIIN|nr:unnamed protein product [Spirodela intermedia]CAA6671267.1 unnamed protein product [Spirodela intermedia]